MISFISLRRLVIAGCLVAPVLPSWSQPALSLQEAQRLALSRSRLLESFDSASGATRELAVAAGQLPDPVLKLGVENVPLSGPARFSLSRDDMTMQRIGVMQELTRGDKRRLRVERVQRDGERVRAERREAAAMIERESALAWIEQRYAQLLTQLVRQQVEENRLQVEGAELAFRTGRGSQADVFAARGAIASIEDRLRQTQRQVEGARVMLARWIGQEAAVAAPAGNVPWHQPPAAVALLQRLQDLPALQVLQAQVAAAETEVRQAQANRHPDVTVEAMYGRRPAYPDMFSIGVSIPLPINRGDRQGREVAAKLATLTEAQARYQDALAAQEGAIRVQLTEWESDRQRVIRLQAELLPAARSRTEGAISAYRSGKGDLLAVLAARREELDAQMQVLQLEMDTARVWARLNFIVPQDVR
ncbi:TolC family protein [Ramlibacter sp. PS3R-8]|uniref:TolC family protein n=1 Tax=Ramlibacter sp. PS3R-8 TaxID=3133437 RepID=UPI00309EBC04